MPERDFDRLRDQLLESGVAPRHVCRIVSELSDHYEDLEMEAMQHGLSREAASAQAAERIGDAKTITRLVLGMPELKSWVHRHPQFSPIYTGFAYAPIIGRWCACLMLSGVITAAILLVMQISITYS
jgi:hypothetical protein